MVMSKSFALEFQIKRSRESEKKPPLRLTKGIATISFILYATSDRDQMKRKTGLMSKNCSFTSPHSTNNLLKIKKPV